MQGSLILLPLWWYAESVDLVRWVLALETKDGGGARARRLNSRAREPIEGGLPAGLSATAIVPWQVPVTTGASATVMEKVTSRANEVTQPLAANPGDAVTFLMLDLPVPALVTVAIWAALVVRTAWLPERALKLQEPITGPARCVSV